MKTKILQFFMLILTISVNAQIKVDSYGKVGIGTLEPSSLLNIHGNTESIEISNTAETEAGILFYHHGYESTEYSKILFDCNNNNLNFYVNNATPRLTIKSNGNIGIGTTPTAQLEIATPTSGPTIKPGRLTSNPTIKANPDNGGWLIMDGSSPLALNYYSTGNVALAYGGGNVGIGNSSPAYKLDVNGTVRFHN